MEVIKKYKNNGVDLIDVEVDILIMPSNGEDFGFDDYYITRQVVTFMVCQNTDVFSYEVHLHHLHNQVLKYYPNVKINHIVGDSIEDLWYKQELYIEVPVSTIVYIDNYLQFDRNMKINKLLEA